MLRHDRNLLHPRRIHAHMRHIPDYLLPRGVAAEAAAPLPDPRAARKRRGGPLPSQRGRGRGAGAGAAGRGRGNPLKTFAFTAPAAP